MARAHARPGLVDDLDGLYMRAIDQLGSKKAPVRLGGLHALGRLGQSNPGLRQTVIDVICAYLRMPYNEPHESSASKNASQSGRRKELQVRLSAQSILAEHLRDTPKSGQRHDHSIPETFWPEISVVDLTGAHLVNLNLSGCRVGVIECNHSIFTGESLFRKLLAGLAFFQHAAFKGHADFRGATFTNDAWFSCSTFADNIWFHGDEFLPAARFGGHAGFRNVTFAHNARFEHAIFEGSAEFKDVTCKEGTRAINLQGSRVQRPNAVSPEVSKTPSTWPPGWSVKPSQDGTATVTWCG